MSRRKSTLKNSFGKLAVVRDDDKIRVKTTGHDFDFLATVENKTGNPILIVFDDESEYLQKFSVDADNWVGLLTNDEGYETLEALANGRFHIENTKGENEYE